jgi:hypothetical protein
MVDNTHAFTDTRRFNGAVYMIATAKHSRNHNVEPVQIYLGLTDTELEGLTGGEYVAVAGTDLLLEGTDLLLQAAPKGGRAGGEKRIREVYAQLGLPETDEPLRVMDVNKKFWHAPMERPGNQIVHVVTMSAKGLISLRDRAPLRFRVRILGENVLKMRTGVVPLRVAERDLERAFVDGATLQAGSIEVTIRAFRHQTEAVVWARDGAGISVVKPIPGDKAVELLQAKPRQWLPHWNVVR